MAERPILFSAPMVRALLAGTKTQTRRIMKPAAPHWARGCYRRPDTRWIWVTGTRPDNGPGHGVALGDGTVACPYGVPGDTLYVRETFRLPAEYDDWKPKNVRQGAPVHYEADGRAAEGWGKTRVSIHMPRWVSRITLRITDVRVERLNEISEGDAAAEGVEPPPTDRDVHDWSICPRCGGTGLHGGLGEHLGFVEVDCSDCDTHAKRYRHLWDHINGPGSWAANPWVWAVTFERTA